MLFMRTSSTHQMVSRRDDSAFVNLHSDVRFIPALYNRPIVAQVDTLADDTVVTRDRLICWLFSVAKLADVVVAQTAF